VGRSSDRCHPDGNGDNRRNPYRKPTMPRNTHRLLANATLYALAVLGGLILAVIIILNLHIIVGLEEGYAASPAEVVESSVLVAWVDVAILVAGPVLGILAVSRLRPRNSRGADDTG
jgi:hypothetical protein